MQDAEEVRRWGDGNICEHFRDEKLVVDHKDRIAPLSHAPTTLRPGTSGADAAQLWSSGDLLLDSDIVKPRLAACQVLWAVIDGTPRRPWWTPPDGSDSPWIGDGR